jgi:hypothetical protein
MLLFALCLDPLLCAIGTILKGIKIGRHTQPTVVTAYADITLFITSPDELPKLQNVLDKYRAASGSKINLQKSKAMTVGKWDMSVNVLGIPY